VRDRKLLTSALDVTPTYLRTKHGDAGTVIDYRNWQIAVSHLHLVEKKRSQDKR
jgi:aromatic-L-amino-acid decarboxylase